MIDRDFENKMDHHMKVCLYCHQTTIDAVTACKVCGAVEFAPANGPDEDAHFKDEARTVSQAIVWDHPDEWGDDNEVEEKRHWNEF